MMDQILILTLIGYELEVATASWMFVDLQACFGTKLKRSQEPADSSSHPFFTFRLGHALVTNLYRPLCAHQPLQPKQILCAQSQPGIPTRNNSTLVFAQLGWECHPCEELNLGLRKNIKKNLSKLPKTTQRRLQSPKTCMELHHSVVYISSIFFSCFSFVRKSTLSTRRNNAASFIFCSVRFCTSNTWTWRIDMCNLYTVNFFLDNRSWGSSLWSICASLMSLFNAWTYQCSSMTSCQPVFASSWVAQDASGMQKTEAC